MKIRLSIAAGSDGPTTFEHAGPVVRIGRDPDCELSLQGNAGDLVSRQHARIELGSGGARLTDTDSSNGTFLNGRLLEEPVPLRLGDRIRMGFTGAILTVLELDLATPPAKKPVGVPRAVLIGIPAFVVVAALVVVAVIALRKTEANVAAQAPSTETLANIRPPDTGPAPPPVIDPVNPPPPIPKKPVKATPSEEVKPVGTYIALDNWVSVLLQREGEDHPWAVLRPESRVSTAQTLVSLPGYRSLIALDNGVNLTLWGNLPEFSASPPVLESVVMLHVPSDGTDLDFTLDRGRVVVANRKDPPGPARVRLRFLRETWELELPEDNSAVAIDLWGLPQGGIAGGDRSAPPTWLSLVAKGRVALTTTGEKLELPKNSRVTWFSQRAAKPERESLADLPAWWAQEPDRTAPPVEQAILSLLDWQDRLTDARPGAEEKRPMTEDKPLAALVKGQVLDADKKDSDNQNLGILFLAALDEVEPLVDLVQQPHRPNVRSVARFALQSWLARGGQHGKDLRQLLVRRGNAPDAAELIVRLLHFFPDDQLGQQKTYDDLVNQLNHDNPIVRDLSFWQLDQLGVGGRLPLEARKIEYDPTWGAADRQLAVTQWKKLLAEDKVPVRR